MATFSFKHFTIIQKNSAMKVNTDGVLLGAWSCLPSNDTGDISVLDIGTGTGVIALMIAQRASLSGLTPNICAVEPDLLSVEEAGKNFKNSPWSIGLAAYPLTLNDFFKQYYSRRYNLIITNPPFFVNSLRSDSIRKERARHAHSLSYREIIETSVKLLAPNGVLSIILPVDYKELFISLAAECGLLPIRLCRVSTVKGKQPKRVLMEFSQDSSSLIVEEHLDIQVEVNGNFTKEYIAITKDFYIKF